MFFLVIYKQNCRFERPNNYLKLKFLYKHFYLLPHFLLFSFEDETDNI